ncbi:hypothetical protein PDG61_16400 [Mycolicibacterium sp. BiH015]|uniref:hypothetical protein n=1 Tax=Mycolicibacterium sp. BiH015 TaxID=3018808 RepID=UPI0022E4B436|nr:hypothetical protein [Mycolicibacterium sp. BiH015]MDA2892503.1 hypothetical protein [Mycolicibacterium sp. BiH015]
MTVLNVVQLLTFVAFLGLLGYSVVAPREANRTKRVQSTRLYSGAAMVAGAAFFGALAADRTGWPSYALAAVAVAFLAVGVSAIARSRRTSR